VSREPGARTAVTLEEVCLDIGGNRILSEISWDVARGEKWMVLGLNGSGKTSLLRLLSGCGSPSRGTLSVLGERFGAADLRALRARVGWVHGDLAAEFPGFMSCLEVVLSGITGTIAYYDALDGSAGRTARAALESMGAARLAERRFSTLSTGERQRTLIARALAAGPQLLLLDEPCIGLDPVAREGFLASLSTLFAGTPNLTVVGVTHHVEEVIEGFTGVLLLERGKVAAAGTRAEVMTGVALARVFGPACRVELRDGRYAMRFVRG
jgi:iron complex transport system ATP-binding protein